MSDRQKAPARPDPQPAATDSPAELGARDWKKILWRVKAEIASDHVSVVAAGVAFYALLSIFPAIAAFISLVGLFLDPADVMDPIAGLAGMLPESAAEIIQQQILKVTGGGTTATGFMAFFGFGLALYGAMKGMLTLMEGLNIAYGETETRGIVRLYLTAFALTLAIIATFALGIAAVVLLPALFALGTLPPGIETLVSWLYWPLVAVFVMLMLAVIYRFGPSRRAPRWRWVSVGAALAALLWLAGTFGFSVYARNFGNYTETYGALGGVVILLTWLWLSAFVVLAGAELNSEIEEQAETEGAQTTPPDEPLAEDRGSVATDDPSRPKPVDVAIALAAVGLSVWRTTRRKRGDGAVPGGAKRP